MRISLSLSLQSIRSSVLIDARFVNVHLLVPILLGIYFHDVVLLRFLELRSPRNPSGNGNSSRPAPSRPVPLVDEAVCSGSYQSADDSTPPLPGPRLVSRGVRVNPRPFSRGAQAAILRPQWPSRAFGYPSP
jgi:hypothetical protein